MPDEAVKVAVRVRPFNQSTNGYMRIQEKDRQAKLIIEMRGNTTVIHNPEQPGDEPKKFAFDYSYWSHDGFITKPNGVLVPEDKNGRYASQQTVFDQLGKGVLENSFQGYNCSLFAYGQTGSGKSYSLIGYGPNKGIVPIICDELFKTIDNNSDSNKRYEVTFSMLEIYNEHVRDLLSKDNPKGGLPVRQSPGSGSFYVQGLKHIPVGSYKEIAKRMELGTASRTIGSTNMNATSSRAHTLVIITFDQYIRAGSSESKKSSVMNLVDLAGSERADSSGATGDRLKEGANINKSLSALGNVISALADLSSGKAKTGKIVVPYRDSVLTKLLQNALGGNSKTVMIAALSPADINYDETLSTLRYADRAKRIKTKAIVNENAIDKLIRELKEENERLRKMIESGAITRQVEEEAESRGLTEQGTEKLRKQMYEEAVQMLTANAEKIAATEGKGPSWEEKLNLARSESFIRADDEQRKKKPHLMNLNEDQMLSGVVFHFLKKGETTVGRTDADPKPDICFNGLSILKQHAILKLKHKEVVIRPASEGAKVLVNGQPLTGTRVLMNKDRILFGSNHLYVFIYPMTKKGGKGEEPTEKLPDVITWDFAQKEIAEAKGYSQAEGIGLSKDSAVIQEQILELLPMINEVNAISEELNKYRSFEVVVMPVIGSDSTVKGNKVMVQMKNLQNGNVWLWERGQFYNRRFLMQDMYEAMIDDDIDVTKIPKEEDPFWEPLVDALVGTANIFLQSLAYVLDFSDSLTITDFKGQEQGHVDVEISPCADNGRHLGEEYYVNDPKELIGRPYHFKVSVRRAELTNPKYGQGIYVHYSVLGDDGPTETDLVKGTLTPRFNHHRVITFRAITDEHLEFFESNNITFFIYAVQEDTIPNNRMAKMHTKDLRNLEHMMHKTALTQRRATVASPDAITDPSQLRSELLLQQRKYERLEQKEKRLQALCREWMDKPPSEQKFDPFFNAVKAVSFSTGVKLKARVNTMINFGPASTVEGKPSKQFKKSLGSIQEDDAVDVYVFGEDEQKLETEAQRNGGFIPRQHLANHYGDNNLQNLIEGRQKLMQRRMSVMAGGRPYPSVPTINIHPVDGRQSPTYSLSNGNHHSAHQANVYHSQPQLTNGNGANMNVSRSLQNLSNGNYPQNLNYSSQESSRTCIIC